MSTPLTKEAFLDLQHMFADKDFISLLFMDEKEIARYIHVEKDGSVTLGRTKYKFINRLFKDEKVLSTNDICLRLIKVITGKGGTRNNEAFDCLVKDFTKALDKGDYSYAITRIFIGYRLGYINDVAAMQASSEKGEVRLPNKRVLVQDGFGDFYAIKIGKYPS